MVCEIVLLQGSFWLGPLLADLAKKFTQQLHSLVLFVSGLESGQPEKRQGVCVGLSEIMQSTSRDMILSFVDNLVPTVRRALCDDLPEVREAAAKTFDSLHNTVGSRALDDILPAMLQRLTDPDCDEDSRENALDGLRQVMAIKSRAVLPYLVPQLIGSSAAAGKKGDGEVNTAALASLAPVAGEALHRHLSRILPALLRALSDAHGTEREQEVQSHAEAVVLAVSDDESDLGVGTVMEELLGACGKSKPVELKRGAVSLLHCFCGQTKIDYSQYVPQLIRALILLFTEKDEVRRK